MSGIHLTSGAQNPYTNSGYVSGYGYGLIADNIAGVTWTVTNVGKIVETGNSGVGVGLPNGFDFVDRKRPSDSVIRRWNM